MVSPPHQHGDGGDGGSGGDVGGEGGVNMQMHCRDEVHAPELPTPSSAVAAASHPLVVEIRAPPQEPLSIM
eukprot:scaffold17343_cov66-Phaeocystis_antarctica.AAC.1